MRYVFINPPGSDRSCALHLLRITTWCTDVRRRLVLVSILTLTWSLDEPLRTRSHSKRAWNDFTVYKWFQRPSKTSSMFQPRLKLAWTIFKRSWIIFKLERDLDWPWDKFAMILDKFVPSNNGLKPILRPRTIFGWRTCSSNDFAIRTEMNVACTEVQAPKFQSLTFALDRDDLFFFLFIRNSVLHWRKCRR